MTKTQKIIFASLIIAFGLLLCFLRGNIISISMTVLGVALIVFGVIDLWNNRIPPAIIKIVSGAAVILCSWVVVGAVLYILGASLIVLGTLLVYEKIKARTCTCCSVWDYIYHYALPGLLLIIGVVFLFNNGNKAGWVFIINGILFMLLGGGLLVDAFLQD